MIDKEFLEILACPACKGEVRLDEASERIVCQTCSRRYPIRDGIPVMLIDEAELPSREGQ
ncbi:MAG: Trm112 family protein [Candidatus Methylomirabilales bacterium]